MDAGYDGYQELVSGSISSNEAGNTLIKIIQTFISSFQIPLLSSYKIGEDEISFISGKVFEFKQILDFNPIQIKQESEIKSILKKAL